MPLLVTEDISLAAFRVSSFQISCFRHVRPKPKLYGVAVGLFSRDCRVEPSAHTVEVALAKDGIGARYSIPLCAISVKLAIESRALEIEVCCRNLFIYELKVFGFFSRQEGSVKGFPTCFRVVLL